MRMPLSGVPLKVVILRVVSLYHNTGGTTRKENPRRGGGGGGGGGRGGMDKGHPFKRREKQMGSTSKRNPPEKRPPFLKRHSLAPLRVSRKTDTHKTHCWCSGNFDRLEKKTGRAIDMDPIAPPPPPPHAKKKNARCSGFPCQRNVDPQRTPFFCLCTPVCFGQRQKKGVLWGARKSNKGTAPKKSQTHTHTHTPLGEIAGKAQIYSAGEPRPMCNPRVFRRTVDLDVENSSRNSGSSFWSTRPKKIHDLLGSSRGKHKNQQTHMFSSLGFPL